MKNLKRPFTEIEINFVPETPFRKSLARRVKASIDGQRNKNKYLMVLASVHSTSETGHAITIQQFADIIAYAVDAGTLWNPSNDAITLAVLNPQYTAAFNSQKAVNTAKGIYNPIAQTRAEAFAVIDGLAFAAKGIFFGSGVTAQAKKAVQAAYRKLTGGRKVAKVKNPPPDSPKNISVSQLSFTNRLNTFDAFIALLEGNPKYNPNEAEYTTAALRVVYNACEAANKAVGVAIIPYNTAMDVRNALLYKDDIGVCDTITKLMKPYFSGIYVNNKPLYKKINHILIRKLTYLE